MAKVVDELVTRFSLDARSYEEGAARVRAVNEGVGTSIASVERAMRPMAVGFIAGGAAAVAVAANFERLKAGLASVMGSAQAAEVEFRKLQKVAELPGLGVEEAVKGSLKLQGAGLSADQARESLEQFGNALAASGQGKAELDGVITALAQIESKGKVSAEEINQIAERFYGVRVAMKAAFGTSDTEALAKLGIKSEVFISKLTNQLKSLPRVTSTLSNEFEVLGDAAKNALASVGTVIVPAVTSAVKGLSGAIEGAVGWFNSLSEPTKRTAAQVAGVAVAVWAVSGAMTVLGRVAATNWAMMTVGAIQAGLAVGGLAGAVRGLAAAMGPLGIAAAAITAIVASVMSIWNQIQELRDIGEKRREAESPDDDPRSKARWNRLPWGNETLAGLKKPKKATAPVASVGEQGKQGWVDRFVSVAGHSSLETAVRSNTRAIEANSQQLRIGRQILGGGVVGSHGITAVDLAGMRRSNRGGTTARVVGGKLWNDLAQIIQRIMQQQVDDHQLYNARSR